jgi:hypothetical protein
MVQTINVEFIRFIKKIVDFKFINCHEPIIILYSILKSVKNTKLMRLHEINKGNTKVKSTELTEVVDS